MQYRVFVRGQSQDRFVASVVEMPNLVVEGETEVEVLAKVKAALEDQLATGKFVTIEMGTEQEIPKAAPRMKYAGIFANDSTYDDWMKKLAAIRREANAVQEQE